MAPDVVRFVLALLLAMLFASSAGMARSTGAAAAAEQARRPREFAVWVTAYCVKGETASGERTRRGIVAADPDVLPFDSVIRIRGLRGRHNRTYTVQDTGRAIKGAEIDIFMPDCGAAERFGRQRARVRVIRRGTPNPPR